MSKPPKCKACKKPYEPFNSLQTACSPKCALEVARKKIAKKENDARKLERKLAAVKKDSIKSRGQWAKEAQGAFNRFIRLRDHDQPCISCGRHHQGQYHAGHYRSVGAHPELRFSLANCHKQCAPCNNHLSGNLVEYRINLAAKLGTDLLELLEGPCDPKKYSIKELKEVKRVYNEKYRDLKKSIDRL